MTKQYRGLTLDEVAGVIDHSVLRPENTEADVAKGAEIAIRNSVASLCIRPSDVPQARALLSGTEAQDAQALRRLGELGFIAGEPVRMLRRGPGGREPLAVQIGDTQFALRLLEARCVQVRV